MLKPLLNQENTKHHQYVHNYNPGIKHYQYVHNPNPGIKHHQCVHNPNPGIKEFFLSSEKTPQ